MKTARLGLVHLGGDGQCPRASRIATFKPPAVIVEVANESSAKNAVVVAQFGLLGKLINLLLLLFGQYERYLARKYHLSFGELESCNVGVVCHDLHLLPLVLQQPAKPRVVFDAREYYPGQFSQSLLWRLTAGRLNHYICRRYLAEADLRITVSQGIADAYQAAYGVPVAVIHSYAAHTSVKPSAVSSPVKLVHHGNATENRAIENMIELMDLLGAGYSLDLYLVPKERGYYEKLKKLADLRPAVRLHAPVPFADIVKTLNGYDVGLFIPPAATFNLAHSLPNKLFEFLQARLMIVVGPLQDSASFVENKALGLVSMGSLAALAQEIQKVSPAQVMAFKHRADELAPQHSAQVSVARLFELLEGLP